MNQVSNRIENVFLTSNRKINVSSNINIILSPEFYWVRIFNIPVKNITQARNVLPTLFEDILDNIKDLSYHIIKLEENKYLCFAYLNKTIYEAIKKSSIPLSFINSVYFAQNECKSFNQFKIDDKSFLYTDEDILIKVPNNILSNDTVLLEKDLNTLILSSNKVEIKLYNNPISSKQLYFLVGVFCIFLLINIFKYFDYKNEVSLLNNKIETIKTNTNLPSSMIQTNSIIKKNKKKVLVEIKKRNFIKYIFKNSKLNLYSLELERNIISLKFKNTNKTTVENYISKKYRIISTRVKGLELDIKVKL